MANPSSAAADMHEAGLDAYMQLGGNGIYLHGEAHSRKATGRWLRQHRLGDQFFLCTQVCHNEWDSANARPIDRFSAAAVVEDEYERPAEIAIGDAEWRSLRDGRTAAGHISTEVGHCKGDVP
jgi:hypothetical protein